jgi:hypothetical protein
MMSLEMNRR